MTSPPLPREEGPPSPSKNITWIIKKVNGVNNTSKTRNYHRNFISEEKQRDGAARRGGEGLTLGEKKKEG